jgi:transcriptional regulator with XRE-family HTH domain
MKTFPELIRQIRDVAELTQSEFAEELGVSKVLIAMVESGQKDPSKKLLIKLADRLDVHPMAIAPFLFDGNTSSNNNLSSIENRLVSFGEDLQDKLILKRAVKLRRSSDAK